MVDNFLDHIELKMHQKKRFVEFPTVLDLIKGEPSNFELSISNSIAKMPLYHRDSIYKRNFQNIVEKSIGVVFVNSGTLNLPFAPSTQVEEKLKRSV